ncbi:MAG: glycerol kinase GlpK [Alphaproteobacteria bacterium]|nr:glycerol kinase GlpK [Alphaproteobacteria bacterium]
MSDYILAIDQGTTSSRALIFDAAQRVVALAQQEFAQHYPHDGLVEHDPEDIWRDVCATISAALAQAKLSTTDIAAIGITNQRETVVLWDRATGAPVYNAIVWQDRRTADVCARLTAAGHEQQVQARTGLLLDPYFSATKLAWLLDTVPGARQRAEAGELAFGTIDSFLLWRLTGGTAHKTDITNASRTLLFDIHKKYWSPEMLTLFNIPPQIMPEVCASAADFGTTTLFDTSIPIYGIAGDQQAALIGQSCFAPGEAKITYGTGGFMLLNTGDKPVASHVRLLTTCAYQIDGITHYAMEGSLFVAGAAIKWLRDGLGLIKSSSESATLAAALPDNGGVYMVPAFVGLGAPHWQPQARGLICGMSFDTSSAHIVRAALESVVYQTADLVTAMAEDGGDRLAKLRVDGGMASNDWLCQFLADILGLPVERPTNIETTALGAAMLAAHWAGVWPDIWARGTRTDTIKTFLPHMAADTRSALLSGWHKAISRTTMSG